MVPSVTRFASSATDFYVDAVTRLNEARVPFLIGGAFAFERYTQIARDTKDLDIFVREADLPGAMALFVDAGYHTELTFPHWLGKVCSGPHFVDIIFSSGNGVARVDDSWFAMPSPPTCLGCRCASARLKR